MAQSEPSVLVKMVCSRPDSTAVTFASTNCSQPLAALFARVARPLGAADTPGTWVAGRRVVAIDGTCLDVADSPVNEEFFGRPGVNKGEKSAFPQARLLAVAECGTHAIFAATIGAYRDAESTMVEHVLDALTPEMLVLADRGFFSYALWRNASDTGADLLWRVSTGRNGPTPTHVEDLADGSWLAHLRAAKDRHGEPMLARVIDYTVDDGRDNPVAYRLLTTLTDPDALREQAGRSRGQGRAPRRRMSRLPGRAMRI